MLNRNQKYRINFGQVLTIPKIKIVCTISDTPGMIRKLIAVGMRIARLNFSHGTHGEHEKKI
ncbi:pyruvate kinase [Desulfobacula toluolica]|uniref:pyruvate kinase n=1 Tax=Desulfobacula toluolica TaxID=28223 RepID=UPI0002F18F7D|nr:pyruvate kinase [Desulfobacula toluolica]